MVIEQSNNPGRFEVVLSVALSPFLAKALRQLLVEGEDAFLLKIELEPNADPKTIDRLRDGLTAGRLELHGDPSSTTTRELLAYLSGVADPAVLGYRKDGDFAGSDQEWYRMGDRERCKVIDEAVELSAMAWKALESSKAASR